MSGLIACISSSTTRSLGLLINTQDPLQYSIVFGPGLNPLEFSNRDFLYNLNKLSNDLLLNFQAKYNSLVSGIEIEILSISMEGVLFDSDIDYILQYIYDIPLCPKDKNNIFIIKRCEACLLTGNLSINGSLIKAGTSAFVYCAKSENNNLLFEKKIGGWGIFSGYDGGAYNIGRMALYRIFYEYDGREESTDFPDKFLNLINVQNIDELTKYIRTSVLTGLMRQSIASLAEPVVYLAEANNDQISKNLIISAGERIVQNYRLMIESIDSSYREEILNKSLLLHGGLVQNSFILCNYLIESIKSIFPQLTFRLLNQRAILGNLRFALNKIGVPKETENKIIESIIKSEKKLELEYSNEIINCIKR